MPKCAACGNNYDKAFIVMQGEESFFFDSFECAIARLAPTCAACGVRIIGHGVEADGVFYCCEHCKRCAGEKAPAEAVELTG
jgi:hypothetical protein